MLYHPDSVQLVSGRHSFERIGTLLLASDRRRNESNVVKDDGRAHASDEEGGGGEEPAAATHRRRSPHTQHPLCAPVGFCRDTKGGVFDTVRRIFECVMIITMTIPR